MTTSAPHQIYINLCEPQPIFDHINNGIVITDEHSNILYANPAFLKMKGYTKEEVLNKNPGIFHSGQHESAFYEEMWQQIIAHGFWQGEIWNRRKTGETTPEILTISKVFQPGSQRFYYVGVYTDITFLKKDISKKLHLAYYDALSELPNRNLFLDRLSHILNDPKKKRTVTVFYMDLDRFKMVNDTYGHCVGDKLLKVVGERFATLVRSGDTIARIGGDEFAVLLTSIRSQSSAVNLAKRLLNTIENPFHIDNHLIEISISIGICSYPDDAKDIETLLANADLAMYDAKKNGTKIVNYRPS